MSRKSKSSDPFLIEQTSPSAAKKAAREEKKERRDRKREMTRLAESIAEARDAEREAYKAYLAACRLAWTEPDGPGTLARKRVGDLIEQFLAKGGTKAEVAMAWGSTSLNEVYGYLRGRETNTGRKYRTRTTSEILLSRKAESIVVPDVEYTPGEMFVKKVRPDAVVLRLDNYDIEKTGKVHVRRLTGEVYYAYVKDDWLPVDPTDPITIYIENNWHDDSNEVVTALKQALIADMRSDEPWE